MVITVGMTIQTTFFAPQSTEIAENQNEISDVGSESIISQTDYNFRAIDSTGPPETFQVRNDVYTITFDTKGATISSMLLNKHEDNGGPIDLIFKDDDDVNAFMLYWGGNTSSVIDDVFSYSIEKVTLYNGNQITKVTFSNEYEETESKRRFTLEKSFAIPESEEYLIQFAVKIYSEDGKDIPLNLDGSMYSVSVGPQIGQSLNPFQVTTNTEG